MCSRSFDRVPRFQSHSFKPIQTSSSHYCRKNPLNISPIITISEAAENHDKLNGLSQLDRELLVNRLNFFHKGLRRPLSREQHDDQASQRREFDQDHVKTLFNPKRDGIWYLQSLSPSNLQSSKFARLNSQ